MILLGIVFALVLLVIAFLADRQVTRVLAPQGHDKLAARMAALEEKAELATNAATAALKQTETLKSALALKQSFGK